jgi:hypothetical protein
MGLPNSSSSAVCVAEAELRYFDSKMQLLLGVMAQVHA